MKESQSERNRKTLCRHVDSVSGHRSALAAHVMTHGHTPVSQWSVTIAFPSPARPVAADATVPILY